MLNCREIIIFVQAFGEISVNFEKSFIRIPIKIQMLHT